MHYYEVAPLKIIRPNQATFTYSSSDSLPIGQIVSIPIGKSMATGIIMRSVPKPEYDTREISTAAAIPPLPLAVIETAVWMSDYYATPLATVLQTVLPAGVMKKRRNRESTLHVHPRDRTNFVFTTDQTNAIEQLSKMTPGTAILHGITGSGKTAVYIELARQELAQGKSVIMLVPEIALTSQLVAEFQHHFSDIILTHSKQTEAERHAAWLSALTSPTPRVVIGPRSALFMPAPNVGLVIIDESHEPSYKQDQSPRYSALRVAAVLAAHTHGKVIQGSATPLISEYFLALQSKRPVVRMAAKARIDTMEPKINLIDMTKKTHFNRHRFFSNELLQALEENLQNGHQSLIFHNRRGSASTTLCQNCGWQATCPRCFVPFTLHADKFTLRCHICGNNARVPTHCPECSSTDIIHKGIGTKLIESELKKIFPKANISRFDGDNTNADTVESRYGDLYSGLIDIIIGTQVIAKGLDLPMLRTVGVIQADAGLSLPDYASSERTFQLLAQVVGRVGRSNHPSNIIVQSYQPDSHTVQLGITQKYDEFYTTTLATRRQAQFPPFVYLLKLTCVYKTEAAAIRNAKTLASDLRTRYPHLHILGPTPAFYERQHDTYRWQLIIKSATRSPLVQIALGLPPHWQYDLDPSSLL